MDCKSTKATHTKEEPQIHKNTIFKLLSSLLSILVLFIILETGTWIWLNFIANEEHFLKYASLRQLQTRYTHTGQRWALHRYLGFYPAPNYRKGLNTHNSLGYRDDEMVIPKPKGIFRIVCMGGSTTYSTGVEDNKMSYPALLEKELNDRGYTNAEVINAGVGAWSSYESLINLEFRILDLEPDVIIIYHAINDLFARMVWPPEAYKGDNSGRLPPPTMAMPSIFEYSNLLRYFMIRFGLVKPHSSLDRHFAKPLKTSVVSEFRKQEIAKTYPEGIFKEVSARQIFATNKPVYFRRNLEHIIVIANYRNIKTVLATFAFSPQFTDEPIVSSEECIDGFSEMNQVIKDIATETGVGLFDFASVFPTDKSYYTDGRHVNEKGAKLKAKLFADYLIENELVKK
jgi:lysophospholipase L1-like esterase